MVCHRSYLAFFHIHCYHDASPDVTLLLDTINVLEFLCGCLNTPERSHMAEVFVFVSIMHLCKLCRTSQGAAPGQHLECFALSFYSALPRCRPEIFDRTPFTIESDEVDVVLKTVSRTMRGLFLSLRCGIVSAEPSVTSETVTIVYSSRDGLCPRWKEVKFK